MKVTGTAVLSFLSLWAAQTAYAHPLASNATLPSDGVVEHIVARADSAKCGDRMLFPSSCGLGLSLFLASIRSKEYIYICH